MAKSPFEIVLSGEERAELERRAAPPELRDRQLELARPRLPRPRPIAIAVRKPLLRRPLTPASADQLADLSLHQLLHDPRQRLAQEVETLTLEQVADDLLSRHPLRLGHRGDSPLVSPC